MDEVYYPANGGRTGVVIGKSPHEKLAQSSSVSRVVRVADGVFVSPGGKIVGSKVGGQEAVAYGEDMRSEA